MSDAASSHVNWYRTIWRWHFYAGVLCIPFVLWLSVTGAIYLFKPQIEAWIDRPYAGLAGTGEQRTPAEMVSAAIAAVPGAVLHRYILPSAPNDARQIVVGVGAAQTRVYVHPFSGDVLRVEKEEDRFMRLIFRLHGELLVGRTGSTLVEIAASWTIVMILTGLFLWWPRNGAALAGTLYPRLTAAPRIFWRDLHAVTALWVSLLAVFLILSGLPWAKSWGSYLEAVREFTGTVAGQQDWSAGSEKDAALRAQLDAGVRAALDPHAEHGGSMTEEAHASTGAFDAINKVVAVAENLALAAPVEISPPTGRTKGWLVVSNVADRTVRETYRLDAGGRTLMHDTFADRHWIDQVVGVGIAVHEGAKFGLVNQLINLLTVVDLMIVSVSAAAMWWRRRPDGALGAPRVAGRSGFAAPVFGVIIILAVILPSFGATLILALTLERLVLSRLPKASAWLGLRPA